MLREYGPLIAVLMAATALYLPTIAYPITGDSISFAKATERFAAGEAPENYKMLPVLPLFSVPLAAMTGSPLLGVILSSFAFGMLSIVAWFCIGRELFGKSTLFPLLILCPYLILFAMFRALAEAPLICFSLLSVLFFIRAERGNSVDFYISALFFGLASLSRYAGLMIGLSYVLYYIIQRKRPHNRFIIGMALALLLFASIPAANAIVHGNAFPPEYLEKIGGSGIEQSWLVRFFTFLPLQIAFILSVTHVFIPHFLKGSVSAFRKNLLFLIIIATGILFAAFSGDAWRYAIPIIPFVLIVAFSGFMQLDFSFSGRWLGRLFVAGILINMALIPYFVSGQAKDMADAVYAGPVTWGQVGLRNQNAVSWINLNLPEHSTLLVAYDYVSEDSIWGEYVREDISVIGYGHMHQAPEKFYMLYSQDSELILSNYLFVYPNGTVGQGTKTGLLNMDDYIDENYKKTIVFQDSGLPVTSVYIIDK